MIPAFCVSTNRTLLILLRRYIIQLLDSIQQGTALGAPLSFGPVRHWNPPPSLGTEGEKPVTSEGAKGAQSSAPMKSLLLKKLSY